MLDIRLYMLQRLSAMFMIPLTLGHIAVMIYAVQGGLSAQDILSRTQGSLGWTLFYGAFVVAASIHASIGLRVIVGETLSLRGPMLSALGWAFCALLLAMGLTAVYAVTAS
jgi:fumarate reductase subunit C